MTLDSQKQLLPHQDNSIASKRNIAFGRPSVLASGRRTVGRQTEVFCRKDFTMFATDLWNRKGMLARHVLSKVDVKPETG